MADRNIDVRLTFHSDTSKAKANLKDLTNDIAKLRQSSMTNVGFGFSEDLQEAVRTCNILENALHKATSSTGNLDLYDFRKELEKAGLDANKIATVLDNLGPEGEATFNRIAHAVANAEMPLKRTNKLLEEFKTTLKNTVRWQISSTAINALASGMQQAYSYAKDLNSSLNDIRIVTGKSADEMADFAKEANKSAKQLSATTLAYTDASLIYFQQGLSPEDVKERTDVTIKMSNVTKDSVEETSSAMTAVWNNFADGTKELEYYGDVITELGAKTAASSSEITTGLSKFASIGKTVGLSFEYATASLATIIDKTRQSEDVVGTALKTIFSRIQSLSLGETLEDGVNLTKYSKGLQSVGVEVLNADGSLKKLDETLEDVGAKWETLTAAEKTALAQTVAGTRQYAQFIALMNNWGDVQKNVLAAKNSTGTLQEQADIYAESWEAARKRVQTSLQKIYTQIIEDKTFIKMTDSVSKFVDAIGNVIDGLGGVKGLLVTILPLMTQIFKKDMISGMRTIMTNMDLKNPRTIAANHQFADSFFAMESQANAFAPDSGIRQTMGTHVQEVRKIVSQADEEGIEIPQEALEVSKQTLSQISFLADFIKNKANSEVSFSGAGLYKRNKEAQKLYQAEFFTEIVSQAKFSGFQLDEEAFLKDTMKLAEGNADWLKNIAGNEKTFDGFLQAVKNATKGLDLYNQKLDKIKNNTKLTDEQKKQKITNLKKQENTIKQKDNEIRSTAQQNAKNAVGYVIDKSVGAHAQKMSQDSLEMLKKAKETEIFANSVVQLTTRVTALGSAMNSIESFTEIWSNDDASLIDKITASLGNLVGTASSIAFAFPEIKDIPFVKTGLKTITNGINNFTTKAVDSLKQIPTVMSNATGAISNTTGAIASATTATGGLKAAFTSLTAAMGPAGIFITIAAVAFAALTAVVKGFVEAAEKQVEKNKKLLESAEKQVKIQEEQAQALENLKNKYEELNDSLNEEQLHSLRMETYELCRQYGEQELAIQSLSASYKELQEIMSGLESASDTGLQNAYENQAIRAQGALTANANLIAAKQHEERASFGNRLKVAVSGPILGVPETIANAAQFLDGMSFKRTYRAGLDLKSQDILSDLNDKFGVDTTFMGDVNLDDLFEAAAGKDSERLYKALADSESKTAAEILNILSENQEIIDSLKQANEEMDSFTIKEAFKDFDGNLSEYRDKIQSLAKELYGSEVTDKQIAELEDKIIRTIDNASDYAIQNNFVKKLLEEGWNETKAEEFVSGLNDAELDYFESNAAARDRAKKGKIDDIDKQVMESYETLYHNKRLQDVLSFDTEGKSYSFEQAKEVYEDPTFDNTSTKFGITDSTGFAQQSLGTQQTMALYHVAQTKIPQEVIERINDDIGTTTDSLERVERGYAGSNTTFNTTLDKMLQSENFDDLKISKFASTKQDIEKFLTEYDKETATKEETKAYNEFIKKAGKESDTNFTEILKARKEYNESYEKYTADLEDYVALQEKGILSMERTTEAITNVNQEIDNIQSAYKSMAAAQEEFNEQGYLSVDTLQSILALGPSYLALLLDEEGNLKMNKEAVIQLTKAKLEELALNQALDAQATLDNLRNGTDEEKEIAKRRLAVATAIQADSVRELARATIEAALAQRDLTKEERQYLETVYAGMKATWKSADNVNEASIMGSSGGGSSSKKENKEYADEFDRYYEFNENLQEISHSMDLVAEQQQHLFGNELARSLRETNELLEEQREQLKALRGEQLEEAGELQASLGKSGLQFDKQSGKIVNYAAVTAEALKRYNDAVTAYNASAKDAAAEQVFQAEEERFNQFKEEISRYDALVSELQQNERDLQSNYFAQLGNELNAWKAEVQVQLDFANADKAWAEFIGKISQNFKDVFADVSAELSSIANQMDASLSAYSINNSAANTVMGEIDKMMNGGSSNMFASVSEAQEHLKGYRDALIAEASSMYDLYRSAWDGYLEGIDQALQKFEDLNKEYEDINTMLEHQGQLIKLLYGEDAFDLKGKQISTQVDASVSKMQSLREQQAFYEEMYNQEVQRNGADSVSAQKWKDAWSQAIMELQSEEVNFIELIQQEATNSIENIFNLLEKKIGNGKTLAQISEQWDDVKAATEGYYDAVERVTEINEMENKWQKAISNTSGLKNQQRLKTLMDEQLDSLKDKNKLSEYDITLAEKRLAVYQAQIALEEAQNNKNAMKLTRGTDGNWSYQYVADTDAIAEKEEDLAKANGDYYGYVKDSWLGMTESINSTTQTALQRISELEQQALTADTEKQAEIAAQIEYLKEYYWGEAGVLTLAMAQQAQMEQDLNQATAETLWGLYQTNADNYTIMTDTQKELIDSFKEHGITSYETLDEAIRTSYDDILNKGKEVNEESLEEWSSYAAEMCRLWNSTDTDSIKQNVTNALDSCTTVLNKYFLRVEQGSIAAGEDITNVAGKVDMLSERVDNLTGVTENLARDSARAMDEYWNELVKVEEKWNEIAAAIQSANDKINEYLRLQGLERQKMNESYVPSGPITDITKGDVPGVDESLDNDTQTPSRTPNVYYGGQGGFLTDQDLWDSGGFNGVVGGLYNGAGNTRDKYVNAATGGKYNSYMLLEMQVEALAAEIKRKGIFASSADKTKYATLKKILEDAKEMVPYDTGGYTGAWGSSGKLAVLHEKELVLNKEDTANILAAVDIARSMATLLNSISNSMLSGMNSGGVPVEKTSSQQVINVTAEFPNATEVESIREALLSLPTLASQYTS